MQRRVADTPAALPLLGRDEELEELRAGLDDMRSGRGRLFLVVGEAGIGKTRLIESFVESTRPTEVRVRWGRCWEGGGAAAFWPWTQIVRSMVAETPVETLARQVGRLGPDIASLAPELGLRLPGVRPAPPSQSPDARFRLFEAVTELLRAQAAEGGLILVLDDLHAADDSSLRLLEHLVAGRLSDSHLLVIGSYRDVEVRSSLWLHRRLSGIARHGRRLALNGLNRGAVRALLRWTVGDEPTGAVVERLHDITDGNPLFVQEMARLIHTSEGRLDPMVDVALPEDVLPVIRRRIEAAAGPTRELLSIAAVVGRDFDLTMLAALSGRTEGSVLDTLTTAREIGLTDELALGRWAFSHGLIREALYDATAPSRRVELHRRVGEALEQTGGPGIHPAELAHHFFEAARAGDAAKAVRYCAKAGDVAMESLAFEDAARQYSRALEALALIAPIDERERYELLSSLGEAERRAGRFPEARELYRRALKAARALGSPELLARAAIGYAGLPESNLDEVRSSVVREADAALPEEDSPLKARLLLAGANTFDVETGRQRSARALEIARRVGDPELLREVLLQWHLLNQGSDLLEARRAVAEELLRLAGDAEDKERLLVARQWYAYDLFEACEIDGMRAQLEVARHEADDLRLPFLTWGVTFQRATLALLQVRLEEAERLATEAGTAGERSEFADVEAILLWQLYCIRREAGRFEEMADLGRRVAERLRGLWPGIDRLQVGLALAELGRADEAMRELESVVEPVLGGDPGWVAMLIDACWLLGEPRWARECYDRLASIRDHHLVIGVAIASFGSSERYLGQAATLLQRYDDAEAHFEAAHGLHRRLGPTSWIAHGEADHARMLLRRNGPGDRERALDLLSQAMDGYRALGMKVHADRLDDVAQAGDQRSPGPSRERTALRLEGEYWAVAYEGIEVRLKDSKGLRHLARLLANPGQEVHALDLVVGPSTGSPRARATAQADGLGGGGGDAGALLDPAAKAAYRRRITELREEIEEAESYNDLGRMDRAQQELDFLLAELSSALGIGGRDRKASSDSERARQSATRAIRSAVDRIAEAHPALGEHLRTTVRTGIYCAYAPDPRAPIRWDI